MLKKEKICILIIIMMFIHGICFASVKSYFVPGQLGKEEVTICNSSVKIMLKEDVIFANEISSLSQTLDTIIRDVKYYTQLKELESVKCIDLHNVQMKLQYYLTDSVEIMSDNSSIAQNAIINYLYNKDGVKWNI